MSRRVLTVAVVCFLVGALWNSARADGIMLVDKEAYKRDRERALINESVQKAVIYFHGGTEDLVISPIYKGPTSNFAWIIPVPARPKVQILEGPLFQELIDIYWRFGPQLMSVPDDKEKKPHPVEVVEEKVVGDYKVTVLSSSDSDALMKWLNEAGYHLPEKAAGPIKDYVQQKWTFVACKINDPNPNAAEGLRTGTLAPLMLSFQAEKPIYPIKLSSANPERFALMLFIIMPLSENKWPFFEVVSGPYRGWPPSVLSGYTLEPGQRTYPTLAKLCKTTAQVYVAFDWYLHPSECTEDMVWRVPDFLTPP